MEAMSEKECCGDDNMLAVKGAGGETHSVVIYTLTQPMREPARAGRGKWN